MSRLLGLLTPGVLALVSLPATAAGPAAGAVGLKPGLWEVRIVRQLVDGRDESEQVNASLARAQQLLASLPPVQRSRLEAMLSQAGVAEGTQGSFRVCVSARMARENVPLLDRTGHCRPVILHRSASTVAFRFQCHDHGVIVNGTGEAQLAANRLTSSTRLTSRAADGTTHNVQNQTQMRYLGADCGDLQPPGP